MDPIPFEIIRQNGLEIASNGSVRVIAENGAKIKRLRAIKGIMKLSPTDVLLPKINEFAGRLLKEQMTAQQAVGELLAIAGMVPTKDPEKVEWAVIELDGVFVYTDGKTTLVTKNPGLQP